MTTTTKPTILITGGSGLLGLNWGYQVSSQYSVCFALHHRHIAVSTGKTQFVNLASRDELRSVIDKLEPACVVHTAGMTSIEQCEHNPSLAHQVNSEFAVNVAVACAEKNVPMIHVSTDNLFDGTMSMVDENHAINPVNVYGQTKALAEEGVMASTDNVLVIRTNFYGWGPVYKQSFSDTIIRSLSQGKPVSLFEDVFYTPILIKSLVDSAHALLTDGNRGVFNLCGDERLSKYEFGLALARKFKLDPALVKAGKLSELTHLVSRPFDMSMSNKKAQLALGRPIGNVDSHLNELAEEENTSLAKEIKALDSLR